MNFKTTFVLLIIFVGIGAYLFFTTRGGRPDDEAIRQRQELVLDVPAEEVVKVSIAPAEGERKVFEKSEQQWRLVEPVSAPATSWQVESLVRALTELKREGRIDPDETAAAQAVRERPEYRIELTTQDGQTRTVAVGARSLVGNTTYVQVDGRGRIHVVSGAVHEQLGKPASDYRDTQLVTAGGQQIARIDLEPAEGQVVSLEKLDGTWEVAQPTTMPAEQSAVQSLASAIGMLRAVAFADDAELGAPQLTVRISADGASAGEPTVIRFGRWDDILQQNVMVKVDDGPVAKVGKATFEQINKTALDLRSREVLSIEPGQVRTIALRRDLAATTQPTTRPASAGEIILRRNTPDLSMGPEAPATQEAATQEAATQPATDPAWTVEGDATHVDEAQIQALLDALHPLRATTFRENMPAEGATGRYTLTVETGEGERREIEILEIDGGEEIVTYADLAFEAPSLVEAVKTTAAIESADTLP